MSEVLQLRELDEQIIAILKQNGFNTTIELVGALEALKFDILNGASYVESE